MPLAETTAKRARKPLTLHELQVRALIVAAVNVTARVREGDDEALADALRPFLALRLADIGDAEGVAGELVAHLAAAARLYLALVRRGNAGDGRDLLAHAKEDFLHLDMRHRRDPVREAME